MRILVLELKDQDSPIFDKIMEVVKCCPDIEYMKIKDEPMLSLPGLEIYPGRRKIYRDRREINLTAKEYDILSLLVANKGQVLTYDQIYSKVWGGDAFGDESNAIGYAARLGITPSAVSHRLKTAEKNFRKIFPTPSSFDPSRG